MPTDQPTLTRRSTTAVLLCVVAAGLLTVADLWTKDWAAAELSRERSEELANVCQPDDNGFYPRARLRTEPIVLVEGYLQFRYAENCGAAFGMLDEAPKWLRASVFMTAGVVAVGALMWMFAIGNGGPLFAWSVPLIVSGAVGNMVDRVRLGYVVDFVRFHLQDGWEWPTFNFADATITVGVVLLLLDGLLHKPPVAEGDSGTPDAGPGEPQKTS